MASLKRKKWNKDNLQESISQEMLSCVERKINNFESETTFITIYK